MSKEKDKDLEMLDQHVAQLCEHFDTVQVFVTRHDSENDGTVGAQRGNGNYFARLGQVKEWIIKEDARSKQEAVGDDSEEEDEEEESDA